MLKTLFIDMETVKVWEGPEPGPVLPVHSEWVCLHLGHQGWDWLLVGVATVQVQVQGGRGRSVQAV